MCEKVTNKLVTIGTHFESVPVPGTDCYELVCKACKDLKTEDVLFTVSLVPGESKLVRYGPGL